MAKIYGAILEKGEDFFTDMSEVFSSLQLNVENYNWLVSGHEVYDIKDISLDKSYIWLTGEELSRIFKKYPNRQWIWAVLSGFDKEVSLEDVLCYSLPQSESEELWQLPLKSLHPLACHEIVAWDSSLTLIKSSQKAVIDSFQKDFTLSQDLEGYINKNTS